MDIPIGRLVPLNWASRYKSNPRPPLVIYGVPSDAQFRVTISPQTKKKKKVPDAKLEVATANLIFKERWQLRVT